jgi:putative addiction module antidote
MYVFSGMYTRKITTVGNCLALTIPREIATRLGLHKADEVFVHETSDGFVVRVFDPDFKEAMEAAEAVNKQYRNALRELASH